MGIIKQTVKCDGCGAEAKCGSLPPMDAIAAMKKRGWFYHYKIGWGSKRLAELWVVV